MRYVLHCDLNNFYASVECLLDESLVGKPVVVCGRVEDRHGIVLAKNMIAKRAGIKTGMTLYEARKLAPNLETREARHDLYIKYSRMVKKIYKEYSDRVESFGIDEAWVDVSKIASSFYEAYGIADEIRRRVKNEIGLTISIGVSFNKVFAKLGSDIKKPDAITVIDTNNYKSIVWSLPVEDLLYVGKSTKNKLNNLTIKTIGELANFDLKLLIMHLGKWGEVLYSYARGEDCDEVKRYEDIDEIKSVGNSLTYYRDITNNEDVEALLLLLSESVSARMMEYGYKFARTISLIVTTNDLHSFSRMITIPEPTHLASEISDEAMKLFLKHFNWSSGLVRGLGVSVSNFTNTEQVCLTDTYVKRKKLEKLEEAVENVRRRFGRNSVNRGIVLKEKRMEELNIKEGHVVHPKSDL